MALKPVTESRIDTVDRTLDNVRESTRPGAPENVRLDLTHKTRAAVDVLLDYGLSEVRDAIRRRDAAPAPAQEDGTPPADAPDTATAPDEGGAHDEA